MSNTAWATEVPVDQRLCLALYRASRTMTANYRPILAPLGLTYPQYLVMSLLWQDGPSTVSSLGERLGLDSSTLSPLLKRLEADDLVARQRNQIDERSVLVAATSRGKRLRHKASGVPEQICDATGLSEADQRELTAALLALDAGMS